MSHGSVKIPRDIITVEFPKIAGKFLKILLYRDKAVQERLSVNINHIAQLCTLKSIVILQKKAVRIITSSKHDAHTSVLFHQLSILKLSDLVSMHTVLFMFDFYNNTIPSSFSNFFTSIRKVYNYNTRLSLSLAFYTPAIRTNYGKFSLRYQGPLTWNSIDRNTKEINHRNFFKQKIKAQFLKTYV